MVEDSLQRPADRPLRDVGGWMVLLTARPILWWHNRHERRDGMPLTTLVDMRNQARRFPREGWEFMFANLARMLAWILTGLVSLAVFGVVAYVGQRTDTWQHPVLATIGVGIVALAMFAMGAGMVSSLRYVVAYWKVDQLEKVLEPGPLQESPGLVRLCTPSNVDLIPALLWSVCTTLNIYGLLF